VFLEIDSTSLLVRFPGECRFWSKHFVQSYVRSRCPAVKDFPAASVSNGDGMPPIERRQSGTLIHRLFWLPEAATREHPLLVIKRRSLCRWGFLLAVIHTKVTPIPGCWLSGADCSCPDLSGIESCKPPPVISQVMV
jgi:hypothetical protein